MKLSCGLAALVTLSLMTSPAWAQGVVFVQKETRGSQSTTSRVQMDKDHIRTESRDNGDETAFVFDGPKQTARMINISKKSYMEITKSEMEGMKKQMDGAMAQMQQQLANLPPAQRAQFEQMMQGRGMPGMPNMAAAAPKVEYKQTGSDKVGQWTCTKFEGSVGGQKTAEVCTVDPKEFGLAAGDFASFYQQCLEVLRVLPADAWLTLVDRNGPAIVIMT